MAVFAGKYLRSTVTKFQFAMTMRSHVGRRYVKVCQVRNSFIVMSNQSEQRICIKFCVKLG